MTDEQFKTLRAMQFAQLALLQSIEANIRSIALQQKPEVAIGTDWKAARAMVEAVKSGTMGRKSAPQ